MDSQRLCIGADPGQRRLGGLLHHVAELTREAQTHVLAARHRRCLDEQDVAAVIGPREPHHHAWLGGALGGLRQMGRGAESLGHECCIDVHRLGRFDLGHAPCGLAHQVGEVAIQVSYARLTRVLVYDRLDGIVADFDLLRAQPVCFELLGQQVIARDQQLLTVGVARELDHLHPVEQRRGDRGKRICGRDEEYAREVEGDLEVVIAEGVVLFGIEHFEQRRRRVAPEVGAELIDLVEQEHGISRTRAAQALQNPARHRTDIGAPVAANLRFVANPAERRANEVSIHRAGDRATERGLADAGRADEAEDRTLRFGCELAHREVLEDAFLHLLEVVVVLVEDAARLAQFEFVLGFDCPR